MTMIGALWGAVTYEVLWGYTSIQVTRRYVDSVAGLATLLPARIVLFGIHLVEDRIAGHPFSFSQGDRWIGFLATAVGAALLAGGFLLVRAVVRAFVGRSRSALSREAAVEPSRAPRR
jgi:hypothetical protein